VSTSRSAVACGLIREARLSGDSRAVARADIR
jgi:hypothetical protein